MKTISVSELKARLSEQLRRIRRGSRLVITDRGRPVAELGPLVTTPSGRLAELQAQGVVRLGARKLSPDFWERPRPKDEQGFVRQALLQERRDGR